MTPDFAAFLPWVEPLAVLTGIACVALTVRQHIVSWPVGIVSSALFLVLFLDFGLYADSMLQVVYVILGVYGWRHWLTGGPARDQLPVTSASPRLRIALVLAAVTGTLAFGTFLDVATDSTVPYPDAATTTLSLVAQFLLTRKHVESWPVWIFGVNLPYIAIYLYKGLAMTAGLQVVFIVLSIAGWRAWRASMATSASVGGGDPTPAGVLAPEVVR
jgi:nicotinamide mononucleotide transporter